MKQQNMRTMVLLALACGLATAAARMAPAERSLLQGPNCARIGNCEQCYNAKNDDAVTVLVCRVCASGYRPDAEGANCECAPGYALSGGSCQPCTAGSYCTGGSNPASACGTGLTTLVSGARTVDQCVTLPGQGYSRTRSTDANGTIVVTVNAASCPVNFYNPGSNTLPCRRCPGGLITVAEESNNIRQCLAGPGYLFDKLVAKACPRGTYKGTTSTATACTKCPPGLTTAQVASISVDQCYQALPGFKVVTPGVLGTRCERNTYNMGFNNATACTDCETGMVTLSTGSKSEASCVSPPGYGFDPAATPRTSACSADFFKAGFNRKACTECGSGFKTLATASDSRQRCYVPTGHGTVKTTATTSQVLKCVDGLFGYPVNTFGVSTLPCRACQDGMKTMDTKLRADGNTTGADATINTTPDDCWTLPGYGYDKKAQAAKICEAGSYNAGWNKEPCVPCEDGYTTAAAGAVSAAECVVAPGWYFDTRAQKAVPCDEGFYCAGMTLTTDRTECPAGTTTSEQFAKVATDCDVCAGGYGSYSVSAAGPTCGLCSANTYGPKGSTAACSSCSNNYVSAPGSDSAAECYDEWQKLKKDFDFLPVSAASILTPLTGSFADEAACKAGCDTQASCMFYQFNSYTQSCSVYTEPTTGDANIKLGMKLDEAYYSVFNANADSTKIGLPIDADITRSSVEGCLRACDEIERCVALIITKSGSNYTCALRQGDLSAEYGSMYKVLGSTINAWDI